MRDIPTPRPLFPQSHACYNVIDGRHRNIVIDTEMDTEIEILMEIDAETDTEAETEILIYGDIVVANVATSPIRSRLAMTRWQRCRGFRSASAKRWVAKEPQSRLPSTDDPPASGGGEAAVAADGASEAPAVAAAWWRGRSL